ncbi:hypothetical protein NBRC116601_03710 [Cognatishimia sp. WU-CL00825]
MLEIRILTAIVVDFAFKPQLGQYNEEIGVDYPYQKPGLLVHYVTQKHG